MLKQFPCHFFFLIIIPVIHKFSISFLVTDETSPVAKTAAAVIGTVLFLVLVGGLGIFFYQRQRLMKPPPGITPGVSFENPTYMKDNLPQVSQQTVFSQ